LWWGVSHFGVDPLVFVLRRTNTLK